VGKARGGGDCEGEGVVGGRGSGDGRRKSGNNNC
jgi:hypothetical protein